MPDFDAEFRDRFRQLLRWRRDVRHFKNDPLPDGLLEQLLADACLAPSVGLSEPWRFVIVEDAARRQAVIDDFRHANADALAAQAQGGRGSDYARLKLAGLVEAPVHLAVFAETDPEQGHGLGRRTMPETVLYSAAMSIFTLWLSARAHGVGLGWVSILDPDTVTALLDVPAGWRLVGYLCLGYPATEEGRPELEREGWEHRRPPEAHWLRR
ncbi:5,6-dimethylbenzimidazole synthase [Niveispirillum sp. BGYR6]|uniref:5,6-dimethylbenzimidazole synthase n=1 Tax=Niveispirillum sp. BGYR6 TaxID=2971249 RepID=UPI0022B9BF6E|nr:5,6-dimethylbenzimidazole synthase [Niveispirillum sp. BGYR6]MDG5495069.1 5,6-dimethylbenzimidazole synthase [Niveispirillum sp. BGYR6]